MLQTGRATSRGVVNTHQIRLQCGWPEDGPPWSRCGGSVPSGSMLELSVGGLLNPFRPFLLEDMMAASEELGILGVDNHYFVSEPELPSVYQDWLAAVAKAGKRWWATGQQCTVCESGAIESL